MTFLKVSGLPPNRILPVLALYDAYESLQNTNNQVQLAIFGGLGMFAFVILAAYARLFLSLPFTEISVAFPAKSNTPSRPC